MNMICFRVRLTVPISNFCLDLRHAILMTDHRYTIGWTNFLSCSIIFHWLKHATWTTPKSTCGKEHLFYNKAVARTMKYDANTRMGLGMENSTSQDINGSLLFSKVKTASIHVLLLFIVIFHLLWCALDNWKGLKSV